MDITYNTGHYNILRYKKQRQYFSLHSLIACIYKHIKNQNSMLIMPSPRDKEENCYNINVLNGRIFY